MALTEELDVIFVYTRTEGGSGPTWAQRVAAQQEGVHACFHLDASSSLMEGVGDGSQLDGVPLITSGVVVSVEIGTSGGSWFGIFWTLTKCERSMNEGRRVCWPLAGC